MTQIEFTALNNPSHYQFEAVSCYQCGATKAKRFMIAEDDLTGKPGAFQFVQCECGLVYQNPRIGVQQIPEFYDSEYIAHRKKTDWGPFAALYRRAMESHDRAKHKIVRRHVQLSKDSRVVDVGCAVGSFLEYLHRESGCRVDGVDFKDLRLQNTERGVEFHQGLFYELPLQDASFDLVTMWHFLEHDYDPKRSLSTAHRVLKPGGTAIIEVPRLDSLSFRIFADRWPGLQAPQHTVLFDRENFIRMIEGAGFEVVEYLPWGAFPAYFYMFAGVIFKMNQGKGVDLSKVKGPYFVGDILTKPLFAFERWLNMAMQTLIVRKPQLM
jgi:2-polyprenyl-3-methyl-5-hydroxy-6-metoxy-1,4-benzoquinol methylase